MSLCPLAYLLSYLSQEIVGRTMNGKKNGGFNGENPSPGRSPDVCEPTAALITLICSPDSPAMISCGIWEHFEHV